MRWENRNKGKLKGTFNETGSGPAGWYWSFSPYGGNGWTQRFSDGFRVSDYRLSAFPALCPVRGIRKGAAICPTVPAKELPLI